MPSFAGGKLEMTVLSLRTRRPFLRACVADAGDAGAVRAGPAVSARARRGRTAARIMPQVWAESFAEKEKAKAAPRRGCGSDCRSGSTARLLPTSAVR